MLSDNQIITKEGFLVLPVRLNSSSSADHHLFLKEHRTRVPDDTKPSDRTLFVLNVPPFISQDCLSRLFRKCGYIESIQLHKKPASKKLKDDVTSLFSQVRPCLGYKVAYVVFKKCSSLEKALDPTFKHSKFFFSEEHTPVSGIDKWSQEYGSNYVAEDTLQDEINTFMEKFDKKLEEEKERDKAEDGVPDDDGWIKVTRHSKNKGFSRTETMEKKVTAKEKKKRTEKELLNFYAFQQRQSKKDHIAKLRQQFEEDKARVQQMKAARKFKPY